MKIQNEKIISILCYTIAIIGVIVKIILMVYSVWSFDFIYIVRMSTINFNERYSFVPLIYLVNSIYRFWIILPFEKVEINDWLLLMQTPPTGFSGSLLIFLLKLPILIFDVLCGILIAKIGLKIGNDDKLVKGVIPFLIWIWNPFITLKGEMFGAYDIIAIFFLVLSVYFFILKNNVKSSLCAIIGIALKLYPIFAIPAFIFFSKGRWKRMWILQAFIGLGLYALWVIPLGLNQVDYSPLIFHVSEYMISQESKFGFATFVGGMYILLVFYFWNRSDRESVAEIVLGLSSIYFAFLFLWTQYLIALIPFMTLGCIYWKKSRMIVLGILASALLLDMISAPANNTFLYMTNYWGWSNTLSVWVNDFNSNVLTKVYFFPIIRTIFTFLSVFYAINILFRHSKRLAYIFQKLELYEV